MPGQILTYGWRSMALICSISYFSPHRSSYTELFGFHERTKICSHLFITTMLLPWPRSLFLAVWSCSSQASVWATFTYYFYLDALYVCPTDVGNKGSTLVVFLSCLLLYLFLRQGLSLNLELLIWLGWLANDFPGSFCLCLTRFMLPHLDFIWMLEIQAQVLFCLHFTPWAMYLAHK